MGGAWMKDWWTRWKSESYEYLSGLVVSPHFTANQHREYSCTLDQGSDDLRKERHPPSSSNATLVVPHNDYYQRPWNKNKTEGFAHSGAADQVTHTLKCPTLNELYWILPDLASPHLQCLISARQGHRGHFDATTGFPQNTQFITLPESPLPPIFTSPD